MALEPSPSQVNAMAVTERVTAIFSFFGILFILSTFLLCHGFDKPINRLIFFASWSNLGMDIAVLIAQDGIAAGQHSPLCQFQAFAIQMYVQTWSSGVLLLGSVSIDSCIGSWASMLCGQCACLSTFTLPCSVGGLLNACERRNGSISLLATAAPSYQP